MKKIAVLFLVLVSAISLSAATSYDIGGGQTLLLNEDGSYEIVTNNVDTSKLVGGQYKIELDRTVDYFVSLTMLENPEAALLGKDYIYSMIEELNLKEMVSAEIPDISMIFLSESRVLFTMAGEPPFDSAYSVRPDLVLVLADEEGSELELGTFTSDLQTLKVEIREFPVYLVRQ